MSSSAVDADVAHPCANRNVDAPTAGQTCPRVASATSVQPTEQPPALNPATGRRYSAVPPADPSSSSVVGVGAAAETERPDGGWGWVVVLASFTAHLIADGLSFSFGILFTELLVVFGETKSRTAWIGSLFVSVPLICGPVASALTTRSVNYLR